MKVVNEGYSLNNSSEDAFYKLTPEQRRLNEALRKSQTEYGYDLFDFRSFYTVEHDKKD